MIILAILTWASHHLAPLERLGAAEDEDLDNLAPEDDAEEEEEEVMADDLFGMGAGKELRLKGEEP